MSRGRRLELPLVFTFAFLVVGLAIAFRGFQWDAWDLPCENEVVREVVSPGGRFKAMEYLRGCGVGSEQIRELSVLPENGRLPNENGNAFRCGVEREWIPENRYSVLAVAWKTDRRLEITYPTNVEVIQKNPSVSLLEGDRQVAIEVSYPSAATPSSIRRGNSRSR